MWYISLPWKTSNRDWAEDAEGVKMPTPRHSIETLVFDTSHVTTGKIDRRLWLCSTSSNVVSGWGCEWTFNEYLGRYLIFPYFRNILFLIRFHYCFPCFRRVWREHVRARIQNVSRTSSGRLSQELNL